MRPDVSTGFSLDADPGPDVGPLAGRRIGFRVDPLWRAWEWTVDEWTRALEQAGAAVTTRRRAQRPDEREAPEVVIAGLGDGDDCTEWSVGEGLAALNRGLATVVAVTEDSEGLARRLATAGGRPGLRLIALPVALHMRPEAQVREHAQVLLPRLLETLGATLS
jgi:hypothetical protein